MFGGIVLWCGDEEFSGCIEFVRVPAGRGQPRVCGPGVLAQRRAADRRVWGMDGDGLLADRQQGGVEQGGADLAEDELIQGVSADVPLGAAPVLASGAQRVVVVAVVVAVPGAVAGRQLLKTPARTAYPTSKAKGVGCSWPNGPNSEVGGPASQSLLPADTPSVAGATGWGDERPGYSASDSGWAPRSEGLLSKLVIQPGRFSR